MHELVRRELWGYAADEALSNDELIAERYQGIRPAPGYPATPDHLAKATLFELLDAEAQADIHLTESMAMLPTAAVSGIYLWHPESHYFGIGRMGATSWPTTRAGPGCRSRTPRDGSPPNLAEDAFENPS